MHPKIACENLWKLYGADPKGFLDRNNANPASAKLAEEGYVGACRGVSFSVDQGEILVIMGLSGSGKSTLIRCLSRLVEPTAGTIRFDGEDITHASEERLIEMRRKRVGMVFQNFGLLPHRTVLRNVSFPLEIRGMPMDEAVVKAQNLLSLVGLSGREAYYPHELSGGQQQRVGIARSLAGDPELWFLDEPFSALDPLIRREMQDEFLRLQLLLKKTIVFVTHDFDEAIRVATRIGIMKDGVLVQLGTPEELITSPANDYVREFTKTAPRGRLVTLGRIMEPGQGSPTSPRILASTLLEEAAPHVLRANDDVTVVDDMDRPVGRINRPRMIEALFPAGAAQ